MSTKVFKMYLASVLSSYKLTSEGFSPQAAPLSLLLFLYIDYIPGYTHVGLWAGFQASGLCRWGLRSEGTQRWALSELHKIEHGVHWEKETDSQILAENMKELTSLLNERKLSQTLHRCRFLIHLQHWQTKTEHLKLLLFSYVWLQQQWQTKKQPNDNNNYVHNTWTSQCVWGVRTSLHQEHIPSPCRGLSCPVNLKDIYIWISEIKDIRTRD